jgi:valine dehydrogenase (NAD+)
VVNAGGIINIVVGLQGGRKGYDRAKAERLAKRIPLTLQEVFRKARAQGITPAKAADELAEARLDEARAKKDVGARRAVPLRGRIRRTRVRR